MKARKVLVAVILMFNLISIVNATPRYSYIGYFYPELSFRGNTAQCTVDVEATRSVELLVYLKDSDGLVLEEWNCSDAGGSINFSESCPGMKSGERYTLTATARSGGESVTETDTATCP